MRATIMHRAGDVRIETVPDAHLIESTDAVVRVTRACICGSDLWPYASMDPSEPGQSMGHEAIGVVDDVGGEVRPVKRGDVVVMRSRSQTARARSATRGCTRRACTSGPSAATALTHA